jgi:hypothetical protein
MTKIDLIFHAIRGIDHSSDGGVRDLSGLNSTASFRS